MKGVACRRIALADNVGTIQRYVEPVPGVDLEPYMGTVVRVRHDTGRTLLASQLELPAAPLRPLVEPLNGDDVHRAEANLTEPVKIIAAPMKQAADIRPAEYVDHDDASVQLLADAEEMLPDGGATAVPPAVNAAIEMGPMDAESSYPTYSEGMSMEGPQCTASRWKWAVAKWKWASHMRGPMDMGMSGMEMEYGEGMEGEGSETRVDAWRRGRRPANKADRAAVTPTCSSICCGPT